MSITNIINDINSILSETNTNKFTEKTILVMANTINIKLQSKYNNINFTLILNLLKNIIKPKYKIKHCNIDFKCFRDYEYLLPSVIIPKEYIQLENQFQHLLNLPQPEQRTKAWFEYRHNRITASDTAAAIDLNPYEPVENFILKKCDPAHKFLDNANVYHGKKYEPIATLIYEHIYNIRVTEFGALPSDKYDFLGASPDGICSAKTLDNKFSEMLGRMLEIKCTVGRHIYTSGKVAGHICPYYYYCQVQQQLECCNLDKCDFWQCKIIELKNRTEYLIDECNNTRHTFGTNDETMQIDSLIKKGIILKFLPKNFEPEFDGDSIEWKSTFIYPPKLNLNENEYDDWVIHILSNWKELYKEIADKYYFDKIVYWKLESSHNVIIERNKTFISNILPILKNTWKQVNYYRNNIDKLDKLREIVIRRSKYKKFNTKIEIHNNLVKEKKLFLYLENNLNISKNKNTIKNNDYCDFLD
jgi:putative phage-type endonuclease